MSLTHHHYILGYAGGCSHNIAHRLSFEKNKGNTLHSSATECKVGVRYGAPRDHLYFLVAFLTASAMNSRALERVLKSSFVN